MEETELTIQQQYEAVEKQYAALLELLDSGDCGPESKQLPFHKIERKVLKDWEYERVITVQHVYKYRKGEITAYVSFGSRYDELYNAETRLYRYWDEPYSTGCYNLEQRTKKKKSKNS